MGDADGCIGEEPGGLPDPADDEWPATTEALHHLRDSQWVRKLKQEKTYPDTEEGAAKVDSTED